MFLVYLDALKTVPNYSTIDFESGNAITIVNISTLLQWCLDILIIKKEKREKLKTTEFKLSALMVRHITSDELDERFRHA